MKRLCACLFTTIFLMAGFAIAAAQNAYAFGSLYYYKCSSDKDYVYQASCGSDSNYKCYFDYQTWAGCDADHMNPGCMVQLYYTCEYQWGGGGGGTTNPGGGGTTTIYSFKLDYNANGGSGAPQSQTYSTVTATYHDFSISILEPERPGYKFLGWSTTAKGKAEYGYGAGLKTSITTSSDKTYTLYAVWQKEGTPPTINAPAQTITLEQAKKWNPMDGVTASDKEDGDITKKVTFSPAKPSNMETTIGKYTFHYSVTDSDGEKATATRVITVVANQLTAMPSTGSDYDKPLMVVTLLTSCGLLLNFAINRERSL